MKFMRLHGLFIGLKVIKITLANVNIIKEVSSLIAHN